VRRAIRDGLHVGARRDARVQPGVHRDAIGLQGERPRRDASRETGVRARAAQHDSHAVARSVRARPRRDDENRRFPCRDAAAERSTTSSDAEWHRGAARDDRPWTHGAWAEPRVDERESNPAADADRQHAASRRHAGHSEAARSCAGHSDAARSDADPSQRPHRARPALADARRVAHRSRNGALPAAHRVDRPQRERAAAQGAPVHDAAQARELKQAWRRGDGRSCAVRTWPAL